MSDGSGEPMAGSATEDGASRSARAVLEQAEAVSRALGHENRGFLSGAAGFMPSEAPRQALPPAFAPWDAAAAALPGLYPSLGLRRALDVLPRLEAGPEQLPEGDLLRAAHVLAMLAHAYCYVETQPPAELPAAITRPWTRVRQRLGREGAVLSYIDLIVYNFRLVDPRAPDPFRVENMRLLTPTVDTREERVFYLTQVEILARASPLVAATARAQDAVLADEPEALAAELRVILERLELMQRSLRKIDPRRTSATHVDPVVWAKTVAPFAVPMEPGLQGPSGTSSPIFNLLDTFLGRRRHETFLGREIRALRRGYPPSWRDFLDAVGRISVPTYVADRKEPVTGELLEAIGEAYAGGGGFLGRHRRKVYGYLEMAFKVGRSVTIGGFSGTFHERTWDQVDTELETSRRERRPASDTDGNEGGEATQARATGAQYDASEVILRNDDGAGYWLILDGQVYDVTDFERLHPGGGHVIRLHAGMDATRAFERAHRGAATPAVVRERYRLGSLRTLALDQGQGAATDPPGRTAAAPLTDLYRRWLQLTYLVVEMQNALRCDLGLQSRVTARDDPPSPRSLYKLQRAVEGQLRFITSCLRVGAGVAIQELGDRVERVCLGRATGCLSHALATVAGSAAAGALEAALVRLGATLARVGAEGGRAASLPAIGAACEAWEHRAEQTLADLKSILREGLTVFERHQARVLARAGARLPGLLAQIPGAIESYYVGAAATLEGLRPELLVYDSPSP